MQRAILLAFLFLSPALHAAERPNVLFILADDLGYNGATGKPTMIREDRP